MRPARIRQRRQPATSYRRLLVPLVDNPESRIALDVACRLATEHGATVAAVSVLEVPPLLPLDAYLVEEEGEARRLLERAGATADSFGVHALQSLVRARDAGRAIVDEAAAGDVELIVLGAARRTLKSTGALVFGSTVRHVLSSARCRVLVVAARPDIESMSPALGERSALSRSAA